MKNTWQAAFTLFTVMSLMTGCGQKKPLAQATQSAAERQAGQSPLGTAASRPVDPHYKQLMQQNPTVKPYAR